MPISELIKQEEERQKNVINLIASENVISDGVKAALASDLSNKYAEGQPGARYYGGLEVVDKIEETVNKLAQEVFQTNYHVNCQAYSGSIANLAILFAELEVGDTILGLELSHGGHLTHGHPATISGKLYNRVPYLVDKNTNLLDYDEIELITAKYKPKLIISGASAYPRTIDFNRLSEIAHSHGTLHLADISHISGLVATGLHPTPFGNADYIMTTTHKMLRGPRGALIFSKPELAKKVDKSIFPGIQGGPHMNTIAAIGVCLEEALDPSYKEYCQAVLSNSKALADSLMTKGIKLLTDGTDNHLMLVDIRPLSLSGQEAQDLLEKAGIIVNKNTIPYDDASPMNPNGIRIGTAAITSNGITPAEMSSLAEKIFKTLKQI